MITLEQHICELQAELRGCRMTRRERAEAKAELTKAIELHVKCTDDFDAGVAAEIRGRGG
jgi:hypothetical protein